jgi:hypothetical protein
VPAERQRLVQPGAGRARDQLGPEPGQPLLLPDPHGQPGPGHAADQQPGQRQRAVPAHRDQVAGHPADQPGDGGEQAEPRIGHDERLGLGVQHVGGAPALHDQHRPGRHGRPDEPDEQTEQRTRRHGGDQREKRPA